MSALAALRALWRHVRPARRTPAKPAPACALYTPGDDEHSAGWCAWPTSWDRVFGPVVETATGLCLRAGSDDEAIERLIYLCPARRGTERDV